MRKALALALSFSERASAHRFAGVAPTTGLYSIVFALMHCKEVHLFGFGGAEFVRNHRLWYGHDIHAERAVVRFLVRAAHARDASKLGAEQHGSGSPPRVCRTSRNGPTAACDSSISAEDARVGRALLLGTVASEVVLHW
jgi:hypothetical protein